MPTKIILDVDTGTDDAVALMTAALSPDLELIGATSVNGNTTIDYTTENTLRVFDWIGLPDIPVYRGMDRRSLGRRWRGAWRRGSMATSWTSRRVPRRNAPARPRRRLADRHVPRVRRRHRALPGRPADEHRRGHPEGAADPREDPGDRDHGRRPRPREHDRVRRVQHLARSRGGADRRQLRPADPDGPARRHASGARLHRGRRRGCGPSARRPARPRRASSCSASTATTPRSRCPTARRRRAGPRCARGLRDHRPVDPDDGAHPGRRRGPCGAVASGGRCATSASAAASPRTSTSPWTRTSRSSSGCSGDPRPHRLIA